MAKMKNIKTNMSENPKDREGEKTKEKVKKGRSLGMTNIPLGEVEGESKVRSPGGIVYDLGSVDDWEKKIKDLNVIGKGSHITGEEDIPGGYGREFIGKVGDLDDWMDALGLGPETQIKSIGEKARGNVSSIYRGDTLLEEGDDTTVLDEKMGETVLENIPGILHEVKEEVETVFCNTAEGSQTVSIIKPSINSWPKCNVERDNEGKITKIGKYSIKVMLGKGGFGEVYLATDETVKDMNDVKHWVAIKIVEAKNVIGAQRVVKEACTQSEHRHENIAKIIDNFIFDRDSTKTPGVALVMPVEGVSLSSIQGKIIKMDKAEKVQFVIDIMLPVWHAILQMHNNGLIHRDLKPDNILLGRDYKSPKIIDFGLSGKLSDMKEGSMAGTPRYMTHEQMFGEKIDKTTDWSNIALSFIHMMTGEKIIQGENCTSDEHKKQLEEYAIEPKVVLDRIIKAIKTHNVPENIAVLLLQMILPNREMRPSPDKVLGKLSAAIKRDEASDNTKEVNDPNPIVSVLYRMMQVDQDSEEYSHLLSTINLEYLYVLNDIKNEKEGVPLGSKEETISGKPVDEWELYKEGTKARVTLGEGKEGNQADITFEENFVTGMSEEQLRKHQLYVPRVRVSPDEEKSVLEALRAQLKSALETELKRKEKEKEEDKEKIKKELEETKKRRDNLIKAKKQVEPLNLEEKRSIGVVELQGKVETLNQTIDELEEKNFDLLKEKSVRNLEKKHELKELKEYHFYFLPKKEQMMVQLEGETLCYIKMKIESFQEE